MADYSNIFFCTSPTISEIFMFSSCMESKTRGFSFYFSLFPSCPSSTCSLILFLLNNSAVACSTNTLEHRVY